MIKKYESFFNVFKKTKRKPLDEIFENDLDQIKDCFIYISDNFNVSFNGLNFNEQEKHKWIRIDINLSNSFDKYNLSDSDVNNFGFYISKVDDDIKQAISYLKAELNLEVKKVLVDVIDSFKRYSHYRNEIKTLKYKNYDSFLSDKYFTGGKVKIFNIALCFK